MFRKNKLYNQLKTLQDFVMKTVVYKHNILSGDFSKLSAEFFELKDELATNGVVRDLRKLQKENKALFAENEKIRNEFERFKYGLEHNGVATEINKIKTEIFNDRKKASGLNSLLYMFGAEEPQEFTMKAKVDAIMEYLGIEIEEEPESIKVRKQKKGKK